MRAPIPGSLRALESFSWNYSLKTTITDRAPLWTEITNLVKHT